MIETQSVEMFIAHLYFMLDFEAADHFDAFERKVLLRAMVDSNMECYPPLRGPEEGEYGSCDSLCDVCGRQYAVHPLDWRVIGYGGRPFLNVLCDGRRVKL